MATDDNEKNVSSLNFNIAPYYDDFDANKKFVKTLFKPSVSVQARELTQLQSVLQQQISNLANGSYKDGTMVVPGELAYDVDYSYIKIQPSYNGQDINPQDFVGRVIQGKTTGLSAIVVHATVASEKEYDTLFLKYLDGGKQPTEITEGQIPEVLIGALDSEDAANLLNNYRGVIGSEVNFVKDELLIADLVEGEIPLVCKTIDTVDETVLAAGKGSVAYIEDGVYYIRGFLVNVDKQFVVLDKYSKTPSYRVGLEVIEDIVTSDDDESLLDNARGSYNFNASGADRHRIRCLLTKRSIDSVDDENFIELLRLEEGKPVYAVRPDVSSVIEDTLARRTYDESGDYTIDDFGIDIRCFLDEDNNRGIYTMNDFSYNTQIEAMDVAKSRFNLVTSEGNGTSHTPTLSDIEKYPEQNLDINKYYPGINHDQLVNRMRELLAVGMEDGKAYVKGYEIEKLGVEYLDYWKSREWSSDVEALLQASVGNYIFVSDMYRMPKVWDVIDLYTVNSLGATEPSARSGVKIGTAKVKTIDYFAGDRAKGWESADSTSTNSGIWKMYLLDIEMVSGYSIDDVRGWEVQRPPEENYSVGHGNLLTQYYVIGMEKHLSNVGKRDIKEGFAGSQRGVSYYYNESRQELLVKHTTSDKPFSSGDAIKQDDSGTFISAIVERKNQTIDSANTFMLYPFPNSNIKTVKDKDFNFDTQFYQRKTVEITTNTSGYGEVAASAGERFSYFNLNDYSACFITSTSGKSNQMIDLLDNGGLINIEDPSLLKFNLGGASGYASSRILMTVTVLKTGNSTAGAKERSKNLKKFSTAPYTNMTYTGQLTDPTNASTSLTLPDAYDPVTWPVDSERKPPMDFHTLLHCDIFDVKIYDTCDVGNGIDTSPEFGYQINAEGVRVALHNLDYDGAVYAAAEYQKAQKDPTYKTTMGVTPVPIMEITDQYQVDNGQRNGLYELGSIKLKAGKTGPSGRLLITYRYFEHGDGEYFTVDSYLNDPEITYDDIPEYSQISTSLTDAIDFRPTTLASYDGTTVDGTLTRESRIKQIFNRNDTGDLLTNVIKPNSQIQCDYQYYLSRVDKVYLTKEGDFKIKYGTPAIEPEPPADPENGMVVYTLSAPAYTRGCNTVDADMQENRRYTMRDIGKLENRIEKIEYYTSLSMLEKETENMKISDKNGLERFKNGFVVDSFTGHNVGDVEHEDYRCAIDAEEGILRPEFNETNVPMDFSPTHSSGVTRVGDFIMLPYTHESFAKQPFASMYMNVNPFAIFSFDGDVNLYPSTDVWRDVRRAPDLVINKEGNYSNIVRSLRKRGVLGTVWNNWKTDWIGRSTSVVSRRNITFHRSQARAFGVTSRPWGNRARATQTTTRTTTTARISRTGIRTRVVPQVTRKKVADKVINTTMVPYIRSREVMFVATGMKPNTRVYASFDDVNVSSYCRPSARLKIKITANGVRLRKNHILTTMDGLAKARIRAISRNEDGLTYTAHVTVDKYRTKFTSGTLLKLSGKTADIAEVVDYTHVPAKGTALMTDDKGTVVGLFRIPNTRSLRFRTGKREFKLSDLSDPRDLNTDTKAETTYTARGYLDTKQSTIVATRNAKVVRQRVSQGRTLRSTTRRTTTQVKGWYDPLAQTFMINQKGGLFLTKIDLYFAKKDKNIPVTVQIRETVNGYPGSKILPGGECTLTPDQVTASDDIDFDASKPTTFEFEEPIYLKELTEYCFVILSNCQGYEMYLSHLGQKDIGTNRTISAQPYAGVFFKSQNASTWTADQYKDLKFNLYRAKFNTEPAEAVLVNGHFDENGNNMDIDFLEDNCFFTKQGSRILKVFHTDHGLLQGDKVFFEGLEERDYNNIKWSFFKDAEGNPVSHEIFEVDDLDTYKIRLNSDDLVDGSTDFSTMPTGFFGIGNSGGISATSNFSADLIVPTIQELDLPGTATEWTYRATQGNCLHGNFNPYVRDDKYYPFIMDENIEFTTPKIIASNENELTRLSPVETSLDRSSLVFRCKLTTTADNLSPIIDLTRSACTVISNRTNSPVEDAADVASGYVEGYLPETKNEGGSAASKYVLKEVTLNDSAIGLSIIATAHRPESADIEVYYKTKVAEEKKSINDLDWIPVEKPSNYNTAASTPEDFEEYKMEINNLPEFTSFTVKIVMKSRNSAQVPKVKDLRVIALGT